MQNETITKTDAQVKDHGKLHVKESLHALAAMIGRGHFPHNESSNDVNPESPSPELSHDPVPGAKPNETPIPTPLTTPTTTRPTTPTTQPYKGPVPDDGPKPPYSE